MTTNSFPDREILKIAEQHKICFSKADTPEQHIDKIEMVKRLLRVNPQLARRYRSLPDDIARGEYDEDGAEGAS
jgi:hypothetical protein